MAKLLVADGPLAWKLLNGIFVLHKPREIGCNTIMKQFRERISWELNQLKPRSPSEKVLISGDLVTNSNGVDESQLQVRVEPKFSDHPLVVGPRYQPQDFNLRWAHPQPGWHTTGLLVGMVGTGCRHAETLKRGKLLRVYQLKGTLGQSREDFMYDGRVVEKATIKHVSRAGLDRVCAKFEATQRSIMFHTAQLNTQTQDAYEAASRGLIRPTLDYTTPVVYSIKCIRFQRPHFSVLVSCINEYEPFLASIVHEIGLALKSAAYCSGIKMIQFGPFTTEMSLLEKHWTLPHLLENIQACQKFANKDILMPKTSFVTKEREEATTEPNTSFANHLKNIMSRRNPQTR